MKDPVEITTKTLEVLRGKDCSNEQLARAIMAALEGGQWKTIRRQPYLEMVTATGQTIVSAVFCHGPEPRMTNQGVIDVLTTAHDAAPSWGKPTTL